MIKIDRVWKKAINKKWCFVKKNPTQLRMLILGRATNWTLLNNMWSGAAPPITRTTATEATDNGWIPHQKSPGHSLHLQPGALVHFPMAAAAAAAANYQPLPSPAKHVVAVQPQAPLQGPPPAQYVPVTMVEQNGRQMLAAVQTAWPGSTRQMVRRHHQRLYYFFTVA